ncbi:uncharacterized protein CLUP02_12130 [Colletotrichum lupini]|uniref:Uncharacterized protein n=1 Tax=Colletotrichum lupini TaxID=145971 RepID=A0A9Q8T0I8_9PEZI|nr:uncharacterized protein CLUP02_12130 [Colletotrichum lupini]UQC86628.1 hypothetical protein CLUP02_12130 [Colletotrichum lupini]
MKPTGFAILMKNPIDSPQAGMVTGPSGVMLAKSLLSHAWAMHIVEFSCLSSETNWQASSLRALSAKLPVEVGTFGPSRAIGNKRLTLLAGV